MEGWLIARSESKVPHIFQTWFQRFRLSDSWPSGIQFFGRSSIGIQLSLIYVRWQIGNATIPSIRSLIGKWECNDRVFAMVGRSKINDFLFDDGLLSESTYPFFTSVGRNRNPTTPFWRSVVDRNPTTFLFYDRWPIGTQRSVVFAVVGRSGSNNPFFPHVKSAIRNPALLSLQWPIELQRLQLFNDGWPIGIKRYVFNDRCLIGIQLSRFTIVGPSEWTIPFLRSYKIVVVDRNPNISN